MARCGRKSLVVMTTQCATASLATLLLGIVTNSWLHTSERKETNNTVSYVNSTSGLWRRCKYSEVNGSVSEQCNLVDYMAPMDRDGLGPTDAILLTMRRAAVFPVISVFILLIGQIICLVSLSRNSFKSLTLAASVLYVAGGLCTLIGIILYIGAITEEVGNLSKKKSSGEPRLTYEYGVSFVLTVGSFLFSEMTGVLFVYLYISKHNHEYIKKQQQRHNAVVSAATATPSLSTSASAGYNHCTSALADQLLHQYNNDGNMHVAASSTMTSLAWDGHSATGNNSHGHGHGNNHSNNSSRHNSHSNLAMTDGSKGGGANHSGGGGRRQRHLSDRSRDHSPPSRSDSAYACAPVSGSVSNYALGAFHKGTTSRDSLRHAVSTTTADVAVINDHSLATSSFLSSRDNNSHRRTTQV